VQSLGQAILHIMENISSRWKQKLIYYKIIKIKKSWKSHALCVEKIVPTEMCQAAHAAFTMLNAWRAARHISASAGFNELRQSRVKYN